MDVLETEVRASFLGEARTFRLSIAEAILLEAKLDVGAAVLEAVFRQGVYRTHHIQEVLRYALIGGGAPEDEVAELIERGVQAGYVLRYADLCHQILCVFLGPAELGEAEKQAPPAEPAAEN